MTAYIPPHLRNTSGEPPTPSPDSIPPVFETFRKLKVNGREGSYGRGNGGPGRRRVHENANRDAYANGYAWNNFNQQPAAANANANANANYFWGNACYEGQNVSNGTAGWGGGVHVAESNWGNSGYAGANGWNCTDEASSEATKGWGDSHGTISGSGWNTVVEREPASSGWNATEGNAPASNGWYASGGSDPASSEWYAAPEYDPASSGCCAAEGSESASSGWNVTGGNEPTSSGWNASRGNEPATSGWGGHEHVSSGWNAAGDKYSSSNNGGGWNATSQAWHATPQCYSNNTNASEWSGISSKWNTASRGYDSRGYYINTYTAGGRHPSNGRGRGRRAEVDRSRSYPPYDEDCVLERENTGIDFDKYEDAPVEVHGSNVPAAVESFADLGLCPVLFENIKLCKYEKPTPVQRYAIPISLAGRDLMACAQTGSGKTAAFCFPIIQGILQLQDLNQQRSRQACPSALILAPTRELCLQIYGEAKRFSGSTVKVVAVYGGTPILTQTRELERGVHILVATPGRLRDFLNRGKVSLSMIRHLVLDEADRMLDMGFEPEIRRIVQRTNMPPAGERQTMLFSATFPEEIRRLALDFLRNHIFLTIGKVGSSSELIEQKIEFIEDYQKRRRLKELLIGQASDKSKKCLTLIFVETKRGADSLEEWLCQNGLPAIAIHGDRSQDERKRALYAFRTGNSPILVATDVASRGLDIPRVAHVINYDLPKSIEDYVHRIGRTGRAGNRGLATAFFSEKNMQLARPLIQILEESKQEVPSWLNECTMRNPSYGRNGFRR